jgi:hypothetical protein
MPVLEGIFALTVGAALMYKLNKEQRERKEQDRINNLTTHLFLLEWTGDPYNFKRHKIYTTQCTEEQREALWYEWFDMSKSLVFLKWMETVNISRILMTDFEENLLMELRFGDENK